MTAKQKRRKAKRMRQQEGDARLWRRGRIENEGRVPEQDLQESASRFMRLVRRAKS